MKKYLIVLFLLCVASLQAYSLERAEELIAKAGRSLFSNPKQASYYAAEAMALFPEEQQPNEVRAQAMLMYSQAEQLLGNFDLSIKNLYDTEKYIHPDNRQQRAQLFSLMGRVYSKLGDYNKAINLNDKATSIFKTLGDSTAVAGCYNERGVISYIDL